MLIFPHSGDFKSNNNERRTHFKEDKEVITPIELKGFLSRYLIGFELTPSHSGAFMRFSYQKKENKCLSLIGLNGNLKTEFVDDYTLGLITDAKVEKANARKCLYLNF
jgi:hypothetical protein